MHPRLKHIVLSVVLIAITFANTAARAEAVARAPIVTAQGVVNFTGDAIDWRVYEIEADPDSPRDAVTAAAGFTLVDDGGLIVLDSNSGREALLGVGEAAFSNDGDILVINTEGGDAASYRRIVLMPDDFTDDESSAPVFESEGFTIAAGKREVELAMGVLSGPDDAMTVPASEDGLGVILVLTGEITIAMGEETDTVAAGDYFSPTGDLDITSSDSATFAVVRIGPTVRDVSQPLPVNESETDNPGTDEPLPDDEGEVDTPVAGTGTLTLQPQICSMGGTTGGCSNQPDAAYLVVSGGGLDSPVYTSEIAANPDGSFTLTDLPYGEYYVSNLDIEKGVYEVEGGYEDPNQPDVYIVTISPDSPEPIVSVRLLPPAGEGMISVELYICPDGLPGWWAQPWFCTVQHADWDLILTSDAFAGQLRSSDAPSTGTGYSFMGLPVGYDYRLSIDAFPDAYPLVWVDPDLDVEGPVRIALTPEYSVQVFRFYAVTTDSADLSGIDSDGDLLSDDFEINVIGTIPTLVDSDGDSVWDSRELDTGTNPLDPESYWFG